MCCLHCCCAAAPANPPTQLSVGLAPRYENARTAECDMCCLYCCCAAPPAHPPTQLSVGVAPRCKNAHTAECDMCCLHCCCAASPAYPPTQLSVGVAPRFKMRTLLSVTCAACIVAMPHLLPTHPHTVGAYSVTHSLHKSLLQSAVVIQMLPWKKGCMCSCSDPQL